MNILTQFASNNLKSADIEETGGDMILTMIKVEVETVGHGKDAEEKPHLYFEETDKSLVLNKTNATTIGKMYGNDTDGWEGKKIALFTMEVQFGAEMVMGIRVRMNKPTEAPAKRTAPATVNPEMKTVLKARSEAWQAFIDATPDFDEAKRKERWGHALKTAYPTKAEKALDSEDWFGLAEKIKESYHADTGDFLPY